MKVKYGAFLFLFLSCEDTVSLHPIGGKPCVLLEDNTILIGEEAERKTCHLGRVEYKKINDSYIEVCKNSALKTDEICDLDFIDEDCDGTANNISIPPLEHGNDCYQSEHGVCKLSTYDCIDGQMVCNRPDWAGPPIELCDSLFLDEDCDSLINEQDPSLHLLQPEWQYTGPEGTENRGPCKAGHNECINGKETVYDMIVPETEVCSDSIDNDCDEKIDENGIVIEKTDFLISIDVSGSMDMTSSGHIRQKYDEVFCEWATQDTYADSRFAIMSFGHGIDDNHSMQRITDFTDSNTACEILTVFTNQGLAGGFDLPIDTVFRSFEENTNLSLSWSENEEIVTNGLIYSREIPRQAIIFGDFSHNPRDEYIKTEEGTPWSFADADNDWASLDIDYTTNFCESNHVVVNIIFPTFYSNSNLELYEYLANSCGGFLETSLSSDPQTTIEVLELRYGSESCWVLK